MENRSRTLGATQYSSRCTRLRASLVVPLIFLSSLSAAQAQGVWSPTGTMTEARRAHTATVLPSARVLAVGGSNGHTNSVASAELYDTVTGVWTPVASMNVGRSSHTASLLPDGTVLVVGGQLPNSSAPTSSAELYDPVTDTWTFTGAMHYPRYAHTATLLSNGRVLVVGGSPDGVTTQATAETYDPVTEIWTIADPMNDSRAAHTATLLPSGKVLVAGGVRIDNGLAFLASAELYDGHWASTGSLNSVRYEHTAVLLSNGQVLVANGAHGGNEVSAELYDPDLQTWGFTGSPEIPGRNVFTATLMPDGTVLAAGGHDGGSSALATAEIYDQSTQTWTPTASLATARYDHAATLLPNGDVLVSGGFEEQTSTTHTSAELYHGRPLDITPPTVTCSATPSILWPPNHKLVSVTATVTVADAGSGPDGFMLVSVTSNEPDNSLGDGDQPNDIQGFVVSTADTSGSLRAERSGKGHGRVYTLAYRASDVAGNSAICSTTVTVPHNR